MGLNNISWIKGIDAVGTAGYDFAVIRQMNGLIEKTIPLQTVYDVIILESTGRRIES